MSTREDFEPSSADRCVSCGEELERGECCTVGCVEYEIAVHGPIRYEVQFSGWSVPCATFRRALEVRAGQGWSRIVRADYVPTDCDDDGLTDLEHDVLEMGDCDERDVLIALIDGAASKAA